MDLASQIDQSLPDEQIRRDLCFELRECAGSMELGDSVVSIREDMELEVVAKSFHSYRHDIGMGSHFRVLVALGGVDRIEFGDPVARVCFASMWYGDDARVRTVDFSLQMP